MDDSVGRYPLWIDGISYALDRIPRLKSCHDFRPLPIFAKIDFLLKVLGNKNKMSKPFYVKIEDVTTAGIKFGKIENHDSFKGARIAVGYEGSPYKLTCIPNGKYRDENTCLHVIFGSTNRLKCLGVTKNYVYKKGKITEKIDSNIAGYSLGIPLGGRAGSEPEPAQQAVLNGIQAFNKAALKYITKLPKEELPTSFRGLTVEEIKKAYKPIESPPRGEFGASLFAKIDYFTAKLADESGKGAKPENFRTTFKAPGRKMTGDEIKALVGTRGNVAFVLKVSHIMFYVDGEKFSIKFDTVLSEVNYTKTGKVEANALGDNTDTETQDDFPSATVVVDPSKSYGDASSSYGGVEESDSSEEVPVTKKKKVVAEDSPPPQKKKKVVEEEETPAPKKKKAPVEEEPAPQKKKKRVVEDDE